MAQGLVFYSITRDSAVGSGTNARFAFEGNRTTTAKLRDEIRQRQGVDTERMVIEVRKQPPPNAAPKPAGAPAEPVLADDYAMLNYTSYEVRVTKRSKEHETMREQAALDALQSSLFSGEKTEGTRPFAAGGAVRSKNLRPSAKKPSVAQMAALELLDLPLGMTSAAVKSAVSASPQKCVLCGEKLDSSNEPSPHCDQCGPACCGGCFEHCWQETSPKCPVCGAECRDPRTKAHRAE